jgi:hypothetical protein
MDVILRSRKHSFARCAASALSGEQCVMCGKLEIEREEVSATRSRMSRRTRCAMGHASCGHDGSAAASHQSGHVAGNISDPGDAKPPTVLSVRGDEPRVEQLVLACREAPRDRPIRFRQADIRRTRPTGFRSLSPMKMRSFSLTALVVVSLGIASTQALASPTASTHGCHRFTVTYNRVFSGQPWTYRVRVQRIQARGIRCHAVGALVKRFDNYLGHLAQSGAGWNVAHYYPVHPWKCESFRPYTNLQNEDCNKSGGGRLIWQEQELSAKRTG